MSFRARVWCLLTAVVLPAPPLAAGVSLHYGGPVGQVAEYRLTTRMSGYQVSLGERRPIAAEAEWKLREEVLSCDADGSVTVRLTPRLVKMKDPTGAFNGRLANPPPVQLRLSPTGEVLASAIEGEAATGMLERALASLLAQPLSVVLPAEPAEVGVPWRWEKDGASQENTLLEVDEARRQARLAGTATTPLTLSERSEALGLETRLTGSETQTSTLDLLLEAGVPLRHQGTSTLRSNTEVTLESPDGPRTFSLELEATVAFDLRLLRLNGAPVAPA
jgi:hypothetical protein